MREPKAYNLAAKVADNRRGHTFLMNIYHRKHICSRYVVTNKTLSLALLALSLSFPLFCLTHAKTHNLQPYLIRCMRPLALWYSPHRFCSGASFGIHCFGSVGLDFCALRSVCVCEHHLKTLSAPNQINKIGFRTYWHCQPDRELEAYNSIEEIHIIINMNDEMVEWQNGKYEANNRQDNQATDGSINGGFFHRIKPIAVCQWTIL